MTNRAAAACPHKLSDAAARRPSPSAAAGWWQLDLDADGAGADPAWWRPGCAIEQAISHAVAKA